MIAFIKNFIFSVSSGILKFMGKRWKWWLQYIGPTLCFMMLALCSLQWAQALDISKLQIELPEPTYIMDKDGKIASQLSSSRVEPILIKDMPSHLIHAIIAVEDQRFYEHAGVDLWSIGRALVSNVKSGSSQGGSTITQQLAKNLFLSPEKTYSRKLKEAAYALKIDMAYNKEEILELYLNNIYMGEGKWGVQSAAKEYFGKAALDLTLEEAAMLAALPKAPTHYSPLTNMAPAFTRRNLVLSLMEAQNYITTEEMEAAQAKPITLKTSMDKQLKGQYASYVDYVLEEAEKLYGYTQKQLLSGELLIYTQLDPAVQNALQEVYNSPQYFPESKDDQLIQSGAVLLDQSNGGIRALQGYRGEGVFRGFNHASQLRRQPGSTIKPLVVYGPSLEQGYTPESMLYDGDLDIQGYSPKDWDNQTRGQVTMNQAVSQSWNIPAVWLLNEIGLETGMAFARKAGIPLTDEDNVLGIALGGLSTGVSPLQMAQGFQVFANSGIMHKAHAIVKITTKDGKILHQAQPSPVQVMSEANAYTMTLLLEDVVNIGVGKNAKLSRPAAGKTGTTELPDIAEFEGVDKKGVKDAWFVGYTPKLTAAIWVGYDKTDRDHYLTTSGGKVPALLFQEILTRALVDVTPVPFIIPASVKAEQLEKTRSLALAKEEEKVKIAAKAKIAEQAKIVEKARVAEKAKKAEKAKLLASAKQKEKAKNERAKREAKAKQEAKEREFLKVKREARAKQMALDKLEERAKAREEYMEKKEARDKAREAAIQEWIQNHRDNDEEDNSRRSRRTRDRNHD